MILLIFLKNVIFIATIVTINMKILALIVFRIQIEHLIRIHLVANALAIILLYGIRKFARVKENFKIF